MGSVPKSNELWKGQSREAGGCSGEQQEGKTIVLWRGASGADGAVQRGEEKVPGSANGTPSPGSPGIMAWDCTSTIPRSGWEGMEKGPPSEDPHVTHPQVEIGSHPSQALGQEGSFWTGSVAHALVSSTDRCMPCCLLRKSW